jgi:hypothetical protein
MKFKRLLAVFVFFLPVILFGRDFNEDGYGSLADYLNDIYGYDKNAGTSAFPVLNVPVGGQAEALAGAFSAVADDASFIDYNPAGSSRLERTNLSFFHNNWIADTKVEGAYFGMKEKDFGFGAGTKWIFTPFTEYNMWGERVAKGYYAEGVVAANGSINFFPGYYFTGLSLGVNVKAAFRIVPDYTGADNDQSNNSANEDQVIDGSGASQSAMALMADVGLLTRFNFLKAYNARDKNFSLALVIRNLGTPDITFGLLEDPLPTVAVAALSYKPLRPLLIAVDFCQPMNLWSVKESEKFYISFGIQGSIADFLALRTGFMLKAGSSRFTLGTAIKVAGISFDINYTLDLLTQFRPFNRVSIAAKIDLGDRGRSLTSRKVDEYYLAGLESYSAGEDTEAKRLWQEALNLDPHFDPAEEGLSAIRATEALQRRLDAMQDNMER